MHSFRSNIKETSVTVVMVMIILLSGVSGCDSGSTGTPVDGDADLTDDADPDDAEEICAERGDTEEEEDAQADGDADPESGETEKETEAAIEYPSHTWSFSVGGNSVQTVKALAADPAGNVYLGGDFDGSITMCGETITSGDGADIFLMKVDINGTCQWIRHYCTINCMGMLSDVKLDGDQNPVITGTFSGTIDLGRDVLGSSVLPSYNVFLANISAGGEHIWSHWYDGGGAKQSPAALAVASGGVIHLTGEMAGAVDFGGGILHSAGESDVFVAAFTPGGSVCRRHVLWQRIAPGRWPYCRGRWRQCVCYGNVSGRVGVLRHHPSAPWRTGFFPGKI